MTSLESTNGSPWAAYAADEAAAQLAWGNSAAAARETYHLTLAEEQDTYATERANLDEPQATQGYTKGRRRETPAFLRSWASCGNDLRPLSASVFSRFLPPSPVAAAICVPKISPSAPPTMAGAGIIVDDMLYFAEPFFQDGVIAKSADDAFAAGVSYFSAVGNDAQNSYESALRDLVAYETAQMANFPSQRRRQQKRVSGKGMDGQRNDMWQIGRQFPPAIPLPSHSFAPRFSGTFAHRRDYPRFLCGESIGGEPLPDTGRARLSIRTGCLIRRIRLGSARATSGPGKLVLQFAAALADDS